MRKTDENFVGAEAHIPLHTNRNAGVGTRRESSTLPVAGSQGYNMSIWDMIYLYGRINVTGPAIARMKNNKGAFLRALDSEMKGLMADVKVDMNRQMWHDGTSRLGRVTTSDTNSATVAVNSSKFLHVGMEIVLASGTDGGGATQATVDTISSATSIIIDNATTTVTADETIFYRGNDNATLGNRDPAAWNTAGELWGLQAIVTDENPGRVRAESGDVGTGGFNQTTAATGQLGQVDRAGSTFWQGNVVGDNSGTDQDIALVTLQQGFDEMEIEGDVETPNLLMTNHGVLRSYGSLLVGDKRYPASGVTTLDGGYQSLTFNGVPMVADKDGSDTLDPTTLNAIYFLSMPSLEMQVLQDWGWMDKDGATLSRVADQDAYEATMFAYMNLACTRPNANAVYIDITES
jgi:hypothetical protein